MQRLGELTELVAAIDRALEREMSEQPATTEDLKELFGDGFEDEYQQEAGSAGVRPTRGSSRSPDPALHEGRLGAGQGEADAINAAFVAAQSAGEPATSGAAMDAAEQHRLHIHDRFYDLDHTFTAARGHVRSGPPLHEDVRGHRAPAWRHTSATRSTPTPPSRVDRLTRRALASVAGRCIGAVSWAARIHRTDREAPDDR